MAAPAAVVLATLETKAEETDYLTQKLAEHGVTCRTIDISLGSSGAVLDGADKIRAMDDAVDRAIGAIDGAVADAQVVVGVGGGTGGEIALRVMRALPITFPKVLITTLPFDPRIAAADASIIFVPTLADICGLNATLREVLENAAALTAGLCTTRRQAGACVERPSVGITGLGATEGAVQGLVAALRARGQECTVFHANGYGGAAFARFAQQGAFHTIVDLTPHELTRLHIAGAHVPMPERFSAGGSLPRIVLPGALNFIGLGERSLLPDAYLDRPHYKHSGYFTHVKLTPDEMREVAGELAAALNAASGPKTLIVPLGGFSHQDAPGGAIQDRALREVFLGAARRQLRPEIEVRVVEAHIADPAVTAAILEAMDALASTKET
ncbi:MAG: Tm-1-like ATP-binding domain-containing protein [Pseudomonadota bacterium]